MTTPDAPEPVFLDTNILVYASWQAAPLHAVARKRLDQLETAHTPLVVSRQVFREYLATLNRPVTGIQLATLITEVRAFTTRYRILDENDAVIEQLLDLLAAGTGRRTYDTNIVATMLVGGVSHLLTNNPADFAPFADRITVLPLI